MPENLKLLGERLLSFLAQFELLLKNALAQVPVIGPTLSAHVKLVIALIIISILVIFIKPLLKWSIVVAVLGGLVAVGVSTYFGLPLLNVFPYCALGVSILMLSTK